MGIFLLHHWTSLPVELFSIALIEDVAPKVTKEGNVIGQKHQLNNEIFVLFEEIILLKSLDGKCHHSLTTHRLRSEPGQEST